MISSAARRAPSGPVIPPQPVSRTESIARRLRLPAVDKTYSLAAGDQWATLLSDLTADRRAAVGATAGMLPAGKDRYGWPLWRAKVNFANGLHLEQLGAPAFSWLRGNLSDPSAVIFRSGAYKGAWQLGGPAVLIEGITAESTVNSDGRSWYALHLSPSNRVIAFHRCRFVAAKAQPIGMDGDPGSLAIFMDCYMSSVVLPTPQNLHTSYSDAGLEVAYIDNDMASGVSYTDLGLNTPDRIYVQGGICGPVSLTGQNVIGYLDPDVVTPAQVTLTNGATAIYEKRLPAIPDEMMSVADRAFYGSPTMTPYPPAITPNTNSSPTAGRTYFSPMLLAGGSKVIRAAQLSCSIPAGAVAVALIAGGPTGAPGAVIDDIQTKTLTAGTGPYPSSYYPVSVFPGDTVWLALRYTDGAAVVPGANVPANAAYFQDGPLPARGALTEPIPLPAGFLPLGSLL